MTRKFSDIKNDLFIEQVKELNEGVYDPGIFKAFFLAGGLVLVNHMFRKNYWC